ncbi:hypothetical protein lerEdw1_012591, partial [Lerista edwardsae]
MRRRKNMGLKIWIASVYQPTEQHASLDLYRRNAIDLGRAMSLSLSSGILSVLIAKVPSGCAWPCLLLLQSLPVPSST